MVIAPPEHGCAWITGASSGIGRKLARLLAEAGWTVAVSARRGHDLAALADETAGTIHPYPLDVTDPVAQERTIDRIEHDVGPIVLAVLNAGTHIETSAGDIRPNTHRTLMELNYLAAVDGLSLLVPRMRRRGGGRICVVASVAGYRGLPSAAAYSASKAAAICTVEAYAAELHGTGVKLQVANPGFVETPLTARNTFTMPMLIPADKAARKLATGLGSRRFEIVFPWAFCMVVKLYRCLPYALAMRLARGMARQRGEAQ